MRLFHITTSAAWQVAQETGEYRAPSLDTEGFIHLSTDQQWEATARRFFEGQTDLVLLMIRGYYLNAKVRFEPAHDEHFPHLYGPLNLDAVVGAYPLDARFSVPREVAVWREFYYGPPRILPLAASFEALVRETDLGVQDIALCVVIDRGLPVFYLCFGAKPGHEGLIELRNLRFAPARITNAPIDSVGMLQTRAFPRHGDGKLNEAKLLAHVRALVTDD